MEISTKTELNRSNQIQEMNKDLNKILLEMPKGILIYDEKSALPVLANSEFRKLMGCHKS